MSGYATSFQVITRMIMLYQDRNVRSGCTCYFRLCHVSSG